ncbi:trans-sialidase, partial [Trypanosoma rangeli]
WQGKHQRYHFANYKFTFAATVSIHEVPTGRTPLVGAMDGDKTTLLGISYGEDMQWSAVCGSDVKHSSTKWELHKTYHVVLRVDNGACSVYIDGQCISNPQPIPPDGTTLYGISHFFFGAYDDLLAGKKIHATVANAMLYNRPLNDTEIDKLHQNKVSIPKPQNTEPQGADSVPVQAISINHASVSSPKTVPESVPSTGAAVHTVKTEQVISSTESKVVETERVTSSGDTTNVVTETQQVNSLQESTEVDTKKQPLPLPTTTVEKENQPVTLPEPGTVGKEDESSLEPDVVSGEHRSPLKGSEVVGEGEREEAAAPPVSTAEGASSTVNANSDQLPNTPAVEEVHQSQSEEETASAEEGAVPHPNSANSADNDGAEDETGVTDANTVLDGGVNKGQESGAKGDGHPDAAAAKNAASVLASYNKSSDDLLSKGSAEDGTAYGRRVLLPLLLLGLWVFAAL